MSTVSRPRPGVRNRTLGHRIDLLHRWNIRSGLYRFLGRNLLFLLLAAGFLVLLFLVLENQVLGFEGLMDRFLQQFRTWSVLALFLVSESFLGLIPPDFFILWAGETAMPWMMLTVLALLSYLGGTMSWLLGWFIGRNQLVKAWINGKLAGYFSGIRKWGGWVILISALFPLPYSIFSMVAGILRYPFPRFLLFGLARIVRFYFYALFLFRLIS